MFPLSDCLPPSPGGALPGRCSGDLPPYLQNLNEEQREAVLHTGRPLLILAGAGSGKTRVITTKIAYFIRETGVSPHSILAVTFTNKAAREMALRAEQIESGAGECMIKTFHSFGSWFLRRNAGYAGLNPDFTIYDDDDSAALLGSVFPGRKKDELKPVAAKIARVKDLNRSPEDIDPELVPGSGRRGGGDGFDDFKYVFGKYEEKLRQTGNVDFGDLIKKPVEVLRENPELKRRVRDRFRFVLVDEYQDANVAQAELLKELYGEGTYLCVVGDDDQSIYRFRGAEVRNILEFPKMFGGADIIRLEKNYRSCGNILRLANSVISGNRGRHGKTLKAVRPAGKMPHLFFLNNGEEEAQAGAALIQSFVRRGEARYSDWALFYRTNAQSMNFENVFVRRKIPYKIVGSLKFYEREEIKDAIALLSFMVNPRDEVNFRRVINKPSRGIGASTLEKILNERWNEEGWNIENTLKRIMKSFSPKIRKGIRVFLDALEAGRAEIGFDAGVISAGDSDSAAGDVNDAIGESASSTVEGDAAAEYQDGIIRYGTGLSACVAKLIEGSGIAAYHRGNDEISGETRVANLQELVNSAAIYPASRNGLLTFLERIELDRSLTPDEPSPDCVTLITLHNTKGLEFRRVIMTGMEQGLFPRYDKKNEDLEEERRLFYVGCTRAMDELYFTSCSLRRIYGQLTQTKPSVFLYEADKSLLEISGAAPPDFRRHIKETKKVTRQETILLKRKTSSDGLWRLGDTVYNDDYGYGEITAIIEENGDEPVIKVHIATGGNVKFLSSSQKKNWTKISE